MDNSDWYAVTTLCPPLKTYSRETLAEVAKELTGRRSTQRLIKDYASLREACRRAQVLAKERQQYWY